MPARPGRSNLSQQIRNAFRLCNIVNQFTEEEREIAREKRCVSMTKRKMLSQGVDFSSFIKSSFYLLF